MHNGKTRNTWRKAAVAAGSLAVLALGASTLATQAFADPGDSAVAVQPSALPTDSDDTQAFEARSPAKKASKAKASPEGCSDLRADLTFTEVPEAGEAFTDAIASVADGTVTVSSSDRISATCHASAAVRVAVDFEPADGSAAGQVSVSYDPGSSKIWGVPSDEYVSTCSADLEDCEVETLADGSVLRTYAIRMPLEGGEWEILVAERLVDGYVISVQSQAGRAGDELGTVLAPQAVLDTPQLVEIATRLTPVA